MSPPANTPFTLEGKSLAQPFVTERGDVVVEGYATVWAGLDADGEAFVRGSFRSAIPEFLNGAQAALCFEHRTDQVLGRVTEMEEDDIGVRFKAVVTRQEKSSPMYWAYDAVRRGVIRGVSVGGYFARTMTAAGLRIGNVVLSEVSMTARAKHPGTWVRAVEVKSFAGAHDPLADLELTVSVARLNLARRELELAALTLDVARL